jgi:CRP-like cAMP-binding protein
MFAALPAHALADISGLFIQTAYQAGDYVFFEGDPAQRLYVVQAGEVKLIKHSESGQDAILRVFTPGEVFGGIAFLGGKKYPASAQAQTDVKALSIAGDAFRDVVQRHPEVAVTVIRVLAGRLQEAHEQMRQLAAERVERRLARMLLKLADQVGVAVDEGVRIDMPITRQDLAEMTGTTLETVSRIISRWRREGIVEAGREQITITYPHRLVLVAEDLEEDSNQ